jgi:hypothetical protein
MHKSWLFRQCGWLFKPTSRPFFHLGFYYPTKSPIY